MAAALSCDEMQIQANHFWIGSGQGANICAKEGDSIERYGNNKVQSYAVVSLSVANLSLVKGA